MQNLKKKKKYQHPKTYNVLQQSEYVYLHFLNSVYFESLSIYSMWISPVFPKLSSPSKDKGDSSTHFKKDLIEYLAAYKAYQLQEWIENLASHDMSEAR